MTDKPKRTRKKAAQSTDDTAEPYKPVPPEGRRWKPGESGNPGGLPKAIVEVRRAARGYTQEALDRLAFWMRSDNAKASVSATVALLNRGWGMPQQNIQTTVRNLRQMTDDELLAYLAGGGGDDQADCGEGAPAAPGNTGKPH